MGENRRQQITIVYDGECAFCRRSIDAIRSRDRWEQFEYVPRNTPGLDERFRQLALEDFSSGIRVIEENGCVHVGADGVHQIAARLPYFRRWTWLYSVPLVRGVTRRIYGWIAANRMKLSGRCAEECEVDASARP
ncbi:MAG: DUF393 domain-containing protein [Gemmatimonadota bacterium]